MSQKLWQVPLVVFSLSVASLAVGQEQRPAGQKGADASPAADQSPRNQPDPAAIERTRDTVKMLDDIYKQTIVLITDKYVHDSDDFPAGSAAVELFRRIGKTGFHQVRLIDVTGDPYEPKNVAKSEFEQRGVKQLKAGKAFYEEVIHQDGKPYLNALTAVPVVMEKCVMCHPHYAEAKQGEPIGAISYQLPIR